MVGRTGSPAPPCATRRRQRSRHHRTGAKSAWLGAILALSMGIAPPARAWTVEPREGTFGIGLQWREGRWDGHMILPSDAGPQSLGPDKIQHMLAGIAIATALRLSGADASTAMGTVLLAGTMKEVSDTGRIPGLPRGTVEFGDWIATGVGGLLGIWSMQSESRTRKGPASARDGT